MRAFTFFAVLIVIAQPGIGGAQIRSNQPPIGVGVGVGVGFGYPGFGYPYGAFGYYPGAYSSSWSNGFSLYGPPVPTYGIVPGAFGGADQRLGNFQYGNINIYNGAGIGLGASGAGGAGPRRRHYYGDGLAAGQVGTNAQTTGQAIIEVRVPVSSAEVFFEGVNTRQQGEKRVFLSPTLQGGITYHYNVTAKWRDGEQVVEREKSVGVRAGETAVVDFGKEEPQTGGTVIGN
ncbi:MAG TPA: TIGR03000 domain-containing protein [Gemmataceae bacterium]|jgi:uncharacterized protein (TIGR03000 family)|nr:TIGR03000 domain-containing protein [Gemmataceae bacterium]